MRTYVDGKFAGHLFVAHDRLNSDELIKTFDPENEIYELHKVSWMENTVDIVLRTFANYEDEPGPDQPLVEISLQCPKDIFSTANDFMFGLYGSPDDPNFPSLLVHLMPTY